MCENPSRINKVGGGYIELETPPFQKQPNQVVFRRQPIDLRGIYRPQGKEVYIQNPEDFVEHGLVPALHAVFETPGWGIDGLERYKLAAQVAQERKTKP